MMKKLIIYIGTIFFVFNSLSCLALEEAGSGFDEIESKIEEVYKIKNLDKGIDVKKEPLIKSNKKFGTLLILPFLADEIYKGDKINGDLTPFLEAVYPNSDVKKLRYFADVLKAFVIVKRFYVKSVNTLRHHVRAKSIFPKDAPIIAKKGEFAKEFIDETKQSSDNEYKIKNKQYKYIEYDRGELGEPVRMMDKNYTPPPDVDELVLALFEFNIPNIIKAIKNMPEVNDGSFEKAYIGEKNLKARILLDTSSLGDKDEVLGVIEVKIPNGYYINGDFFNDKYRPRFILKEDNDEEYNIKDYKLYNPLPIGVEKGGVARRLFVNTVNFPFKVTRNDLKKGIYIAGDFYFWLCDKKDNQCFQTKTEHGIRLKPSLDDAVSLYNNYVTQAHTHLPDDKIKYAEVTKTIYNKEKNMLEVSIDTRKKVSNVAVMVEDKYSTNFLNPRYQINENNIIASFDVKKEFNEREIKEVAISVLLDEYDIFRTVNTVDFVENVSDEIRKISLIEAYLLGIMIVFMGGAFYLFLLFTKLIVNRDDRIKIFVRYVLGCLFGILILATLFRGKDIGYIYSNSWFICFCSIICISFMCMMYGCVDFVLFRPFKKNIKYGFFSGLFIVLLGCSLPFYNIIIENITVSSFRDNRVLFVIFSFLSGIVSISLIGFVFYKKNIIFNLELKNFNIIYSVFYLIFMLWIAYGVWGSVSTFIYICLLFIIGFIWYKYPVYIQNKCLKIRSKQKKEIAFYNIQNKVLGVIIVVYVISSIGINIFSKKDVINPSIVEINEVITKQIEKNNPVLVVVEANWSLKSVANKIKLNKLHDKGMSIAFVNANIANEDSIYWLKRYDKKEAPLYVLFTKRHKNGLVLPDDLRDVNFRKAVKNFDD